MNIMKNSQASNNQTVERQNEMSYAEVCLKLNSYHLQTLIFWVAEFCLNISKCFSVLT